MSNIKISNKTEIPQSGPIRESLRQKSWTVPEARGYIGDWLFSSSFKNIRMDSDGLDYIRVGGRPDGISSLHKSPLSICQDDNRLFIGQYEGEFLRIYNKQSLDRIPHNIEFKRPIHSVHIDEDFLYVGESGSDGLRIFSNGDNIAELQFDLSFQSTITQIESDSRYIYLSHHADGFFTVIDKETMEKVDRVPNLGKFCHGFVHDDLNIYLLLTNELKCLNKVNWGLSNSAISFIVPPSSPPTVQGTEDEDASPEDVLNSLSYDTDYISLGLTQNHPLPSIPSNRKGNTINLHDGKIYISYGTRDILVCDTADDFETSFYSLYDGLVSSVSIKDDFMYIGVKPSKVRSNNNNLLVVDLSDMSIFSTMHIGEDITNVYCTEDYIVIGDTNGERAHAIGYDLSARYPIDRFVKPLSSPILVGSTVYYMESNSIIDSSTGNARITIPSLLIKDLESDDNFVYVHLRNDALKVFDHDFSEVSQISNVSRYAYCSDYILISTVENDTVKVYSTDNFTVVREKQYTGRNISHLYADDEHFIVSFNDTDGGSHINDHELNRLPILLERTNNVSSVYMDESIFISVSPDRYIDFISKKDWSIISTFRLPTVSHGVFRDGNSYYIGYGQNNQFVIFEVGSDVVEDLPPSAQDSADSFGYDTDYYDKTNVTSTELYAINTLNYDTDYYNFVLIGAQQTIDTLTYDVDPFYLSRTALNTIGGVNYDVDFMAYRRSAQQTIDSINYDVDRYND